MSSTHQEPKYKLGAFGFLILYQAVLIGSIQTVPILTPWISEELPALEGLIGLFVSWVVLSALLCSGLIIVMLRRVEAVRGALISLMTVILGLAVLIISEGIFGFLIAGFLLGLSYSALNPIGSQIVSSMGEPRRSNFLFSIKQSSVSIGAGTAGLLLPPLAALTSWHISLGSIIVLALLVIAFGILMRPSVTPVSRVTNYPLRLADLLPLSGFLLFVRNPEGKRLAFASMTFALAQYGIMAVYVVWASGSLKLDAGMAGLLFFVVMMAGIFGRVFWGYVADFVNPSRVLVLQLASASLCSLFMAIAPTGVDIVLLFGFSGILGFVAMSWSGILLSEVARVGSSMGDPRQGIIDMTSGVQVLFYIGGLIGPSLLSIVYLNTGSFSLGYIIISMLFVISIWFYCGKPNVETQ